MTMKTKVKAGDLGLTANHNQTVADGLLMRGGEGGRPFGQP